MGREELGKKLAGRTGRLVVGELGEKRKRNRKKKNNNG